MDIQDIYKYAQVALPKRQIGADIRFLSSGFMPPYWFKEPVYGFKYLECRKPSEPPADPPEIIHVPPQCL
jgi:hypothetical protein